MSNMTGFTGEEIMTMIKELFPHTGIMVKREYWNSYDQMNKMILEKNNIYANLQHHTLLMCDQLPHF